MSVDWPIHSLSEFISVKHGFAFKGEYFRSEETNDYLLTPGNFAVSGGFKADKFKYYDGPIPNNYILSEGDLIVTMTDLSKQADTLGYSALVPTIEGKKLLHNQRTGRVEFINNELDKTYLYFLLRSIGYRHHVLSGVTGTTVKHTSPTKIVSFEFHKPPLDVQIKIGKQLIILEKKTQLNRQTNKTLESLAQAFFKSWFVDFDPVKAKEKLKQEGGDLDSIAKELGMSKEILELFPDEFEESELGLIPKGWETKSIKDVAKIIKGKSYKSIELSESTTALVTLKSFKRGGGYRLDGLKEYIGKYEPEQEVFAGDLIIAYTDVTQAADVIGKPAMVINDNRYDHLVVSLDVAVIRPNDDLFKNYLYGLAMTDSFQSHTKSHSTGTTVLHLSKDAVPSYKFCIPSEELLEKYASFSLPLFKLINENIENDRNLTRLRDTLLPKLLSGDISIESAIISSKEDV